MVAILEKTEHNTDFYQIVDFLEASSLRYALLVPPTIYVLHIRHFWSTARIETADGETHIIAKINGEQVTVSESSIRRKLKLKDEEGISDLPDTDLFENLSWMGYNIFPNQRFSFQKGQFTHQWKFSIHTIMQCLSPKSTAFNEFSSNIATAIVCLATNRVYNFSKMIFDGMITNIKRKGNKKFLMYPRFLEKILRMSQFGEIKHTETYHVPSQTAKVFTTLRVNSPSFSGKNVDLFDTMIVPQGEGQVNPTEPHHTPLPPPASPPQIEHTIPSPSQAIHTTPSDTQTTQQASFPPSTQIPSQTPTTRRLTKRDIRIAQSRVPTPVADEPASPPRDDSHGEAFPTATSLDAGQDRENIAKTSAMPYDSSPRVTSLGGDEGRGNQEDAPNRGGIIDQGEELGIERDSNKSTDKGSESTEEMANVLSSMGAVNILSSRGLKESFTPASPQVAPASLQVPPASIIDVPAVATASERTPTAVTSTTTRVITSYTRRTRASRGIIAELSQPSHTTTTPTFISKGKEIMTEPEPEKPSKKRVREQMSEQLARQLEEEFAQENQAIREQVARDAEIAKIQAEEDLRQMIDELDRSNEMVNKHMAEYEQAEQDLSLEEKIDLIKVLLNYQKHLAQVKKYQAQQQKLGSKSERRKFYTAVLKSHAG
ncbi:hypothetical protein Tco_0565965 [Tanacetum coccineum]